MMGHKKMCARERIRTSKPLRALPPQGSASANSATRAINLQLFGGAEFLPDFRSGTVAEIIDFGTGDLARSV
jgi:hypothetical protein